jgi:hypothetical protein
MRTKAYGINVIGKKDFCEQTKNALALLVKKDHDSFKKVKNYIKIILEAKISGIDKKNKAFQVARYTAFPDGCGEEDQLIWYASCLVHDATHVEVENTFRGRGRKELLSPEEAEKEEMFCCRVQKKCLIGLGASAQHFIYLNDQIKRKYWVP